MNNHNKEIGERIFNVIKHLEMTVDKFAELTGTTKFRLYSYKAGKAEAPQDLLEEMENKLEINSKYIRKGEEPILLNNEQSKPYNQSQLKLLKMETRKEHRIPIYLMSVAAGHPVSVDDYVDRYLNIDKIFTDNHFVVYVQGDSMTGVGIEDGDMLLVDAKKNYVNGDIVVASVDGFLTLKTIKKDNGSFMLFPENPAYEPIKITETTQIMGVVVWTMKEMKSRK